MNDESRPMKAAEHVLLAFEGASPGKTISYRQLEDFLKKHHFPIKESAAGLYYGRQQGWIRVDSFHSITLLLPGFDKLSELIK